MSPLVLERVVLGPRRGGRDYDLLAQSPGVALTANASRKLREFFFEILPLVGADRDVHAFFPIEHPTEVQQRFLCTIARHGEVDGNPIWIGSGLLLSEAQVRAMQGWVPPLLGRWPYAAPPSHGDLLEPLTYDPGPPPAPHSAGKPGKADDAAAIAELLKAGSEQVEVKHASEVVDALANILAAMPVARRVTASFLTAPPVLNSAPSITLSIFPAADRAALGPKAQERLSRRTVRPTQINLSHNAWTEFLIALEDAGVRTTDLAAVGGRVFTEAENPPQITIGKRTEHFLATSFPDESERIDALFAMMQACAETPGEYLNEIMEGLVLAFQECVRQALNPGLWIERYAAFEPDLPTRFQFPAMILRLAIEERVFIHFDRRRLEAIGLEDVPMIAKLAPAHDIAIDERASDWLLTLLKRLTEALKPEEDDQEIVALGEQLLTELAKPRHEKMVKDFGREILAGWLTTALRFDHGPALEALIRSGLAERVGDGLDRRAMDVWAGALVRAVDRAPENMNDPDWVHNLEFSFTVITLAKGERGREVSVLS